jgi:hypothetical protein
MAVGEAPFAFATTLAGGLDDGPRRQGQVRGVEGAIRLRRPPADRSLTWETGAR